MPSKKDVTIEDLASMVQNGFLEIKKDHGKRFDSIDERLDRIENLLIKDHHRRIERLEKSMKQVRELLTVK